MAGDQRNRLGYLGMVRFYHGSSLLWEGQLEDKGASFDAKTRTTHARAFGLRRKLDETSVRRIWAKRDLGWSTPPVGAGGKLATTAGLDINRTTTGFAAAFGAVVPTDLSQNGINFAGNGVSVATQFGEAFDFIVPSGLTLQRILGTATAGGAFASGPLDLLAFTGYTTDGSTWSSNDFVGSGSLNASVANAIRLRIGVYNQAGALTPTSADTWRLTDIRVLGTALTEDISGGFYGGTILRDLVALCPELNVGLIEDGSDYTIQAIERSVRDAATSVVTEVAGYYAREWAVWEDGRFDWKTRNLDEPQWIAKLTDIDALELDASVDNLARTVYVLYTDAASGLDAEASATATDQRNPYVRQAKTKDLLVTPGFPMTANTSAQLAATIAADAGARPSVGGQCVLAADKLLTNAVGTARPAALIRGGDNIVFPELPKTDVLLQGRDGETLFHIASVELDVDANKITLTLEGQQRRTDVILARLAAATRVLTG